MCTLSIFKLYVLFQEIEPKLCYERLTNDVPNILKKDAASCIAVHTKVIYIMKTNI